jgi:hypothetical protein
MAGHFIKFNEGWAHISCPNIYKYHGITFEVHNYCGPMGRIKKDGGQVKSKWAENSGKCLISGLN